MFVPPPFVVNGDMGNHWVMRTFGRRTAIGATSLALVLAATGTSLAAVRSARSEGGVEPSGLAMPAPAARGARPGVTLPPTAELPGAEPLDPTRPPQPAPPAPGAVTPAPAAPAGEGAAPAEPDPRAPQSGGSTQPGGPAPLASPRPRIAPPVPIGGPSPTLPPGVSPTPTLGCPSNTAVGALPPASGVLRAVDFTLAWPGRGPLVLLPQVSAVRNPGVPITIVGSTSGALATDGSSLSLDGPVTAGYTVLSGGSFAQGTIRFGADAPVADVARDACPDRSFVLHDIAQATLAGSPLRIVGVVATPGTITIDEHGGIARFRSAAAATHRVSLLTASDAGVAGPIVNATVTVG